MRDTPLRRIRHAYGIRVVEIAAASGLSIDTVRRIDRGDVMTLQVQSLLRVARALGSAPHELVPELAQTPSHGGLIAQRERLRSLP